MTDQFNRQLGWSMVALRVAGRGCSERGLDLRTHPPVEGAKAASET